MRPALTLLAACLAPSALAMPTKQAEDEIKDPDILNYALALEYLERKFYTEGLEKFDQQAFTKAGFTKDFYTHLQTIKTDEESHVKFLSAALGESAIKEPSFKFPYKDVKSFVGLSSVLEGVGVSAYLGAAAAIANKQYLTVAGSILTVEARHASFVRAALKQKPFAAPFDTPLGFNQVYSLAAQFVTGFAEGTKLPFKAFPTLTATPSSSGKLCAGSGTVSLNVTDPKAEVNAEGTFAVFYSGLDTYHVPVEGKDKVFTAKIPGANFASEGQAAPSGQTYVLLSTADSKDKASDANIIAGVGIVEITC